MRRRYWAAVVLAGFVLVAASIGDSGPPQFVWTDGNILTTEPRGPSVRGFKRGMDVAPEKVAEHTGAQGIETWLRTQFFVRRDRSPIGDSLRRTFPMCFDKGKPFDDLIWYHAVDGEPLVVDATGIAWARCEVVPNER